MKKHIVHLIIVLLLVVPGCSNSKKEKPSDISQEIWDKSIQYATMAYVADYENNIFVFKLASFFDEFDDIENKTESEERLISLVEKMIVNKNDMIHSKKVGLKSGESEKIYKDSLKALTTIVGESALDINTLDTALLETYSMEKTYKEFDEESTREANDNSEGFSYIKEYQKQNRLKARDVQFDMGNNLDKNFIVEGTAFLDDYYNYGFGNEIEDKYFCARVNPDDGSDSWYLYFERKSFKELFEALKSGGIHITATAMIPSYMYVEGQGNMAKVGKVEPN